MIFIRNFTKTKITNSFLPPSTDNYGTLHRRELSALIFFGGLACIVAGVLLIPLERLRQKLKRTSIGPEGADRTIDALKHRKDQKKSAEVIEMLGKHGDAVAVLKEYYDLNRGAGARQNAGNGAGSKKSWKEKMRFSQYMHKKKIGASSPVADYARNGGAW